MLKWITLCLIVWGASGAPSREDALCDVCHMLVGEVQDLLKVGIAKNQIKEYVRGICQRLPSDEKDVCNVIIQGHTEAVLNKMVSDLTPHQVCQKLSNVCPVPVEVLEEEPVEQFEEEPIEESVEEPMVEPLENVGDLKCDVCEFIIATLDKYIEKNSSIAAINKTLEEFCNALPPQIGDICKQFEPDLISVLGKGLPPKTACATIRLCDAAELESYDTPCDICYKVMGAFGLKDVESVCSKWQTCQPEEEEIERATPEEQENLGSLECDVCEFIIATLDKYIEKNSSIAAINKTLESFCTALPQQIEDICRNIEPDIIYVLGKGLPPKTACATIRLCDAEQLESYDTPCDICYKVMGAFGLKEVESVCSKWQTCQPEEEEIEKATPEEQENLGSLECDVCEFIIATLDKYIEKNSSIAAINKTLESFCTALPQQIEDICRNIEPDIIYVLGKGLPPKTACATIRLCDAEQLESYDTPCDICYKVMGAFGLKEVESVCSKWQTCQPEEEEIERATPEEQENLGTIECDICKLLVDYAEKYIEENHTIEEINATLRGFCKDLPDFLQDPCLNEVVPEILKVIKDDPDPATVCADIKLCDAIEESGISPCDVCFNIARRLGIEDVDSLCSKVKTCQPEEEEIEKVTAEKQENLGDLECDICKFLVDYAEKFIEENKTIAEINATLRGFCKDLPASLQDPCLNDVVPEILKVIKDDPDPATVCADIKLCDAIEESGMSPCDVCFNIARRVGLKDVDSLCSKVKTCQPEEEEIEKVTPEEQENLGTVQCDICKLLVDVAETYVEENRTIEKLNATLRGICKELPSKDIQDKCLNEVVPKLLKELKEHRTPTSICADIDFCDAIEESRVSPCDVCYNIARRLGFKDAEMVCSKLKTCQPEVKEIDEASVEETVQCSLCKFLVDGAEEYITENSTIKEINSTLENLCNALPDSIKPTCLTVEPYLIGFLQQPIPPETICEAVKFCEPKDSSAPISHLSCDDCYAALETLGYKEPEAVCAKVKDCREMLASALENYNEPEQETPVVMEMQQKENVKEDPKCEVCELLVLFLDQVAKDNVSLADLNKTMIEFCDFLPETLDLRKAADARCELCKFTLTLLDGALKKDDPKLNQTLTNLCNSLPDTYKSICLALVPTIVKEAKAGFPPQQTCAAAGFCTSESSEREPLAELCDRCMGMLEGMGEEAADALCSKMCHGRHRRSVELSKDVKSDVKKMAQSLSKGTKAGGLVECEACKIFVQTLDDFLGQNKTEKTVNDTVFDICQKLTGGQLVHMCLQDAPKLVKILLNGLDPEKTCITLGLCTVKAGFNELNLRKLVKRDVQDKELKIQKMDDWECSLCELLVNVIDSYLKKNASAKEVNDTVYRVCDTLPSKLMKDLCYKMAPTLCKDIEKGFDPKRACQDLGLCLNETTLALNPFELEDQACDVCKFLEEFVAPLIGPNTTDAQVNKTLIDICNSLPDLLQKTCYDVAKDLLHAFDDRKDPEKACEDVGLCSAVAFDKTLSAKKDVILSEKLVKPIEREIDIQPKTVGKSIFCLVCEAAITTIDKDLEKNSTEKKINDTVYGACEKLPSSLKDICLSFAGLVVKELTSGLEPEKVCEAIKLCESDMKTLALNPFELKDEACDVCKILEQFAAPLIGPNTTEADVNATLFGICASLPDILQQPCDNAANKLVQAFVDKDNPEKACEDVGLCSAVAFETVIRSPIKPKKPVKCESCMKAMQHVYNDLFQNYPKVRSAVISKVCNKLPETYKAICMRLSNSHLNGYWKTFLDNYTPSLLCEMAECVEQEFSFQPAKKSNRT